MDESYKGHRIKSTARRLAGDGWGVHLRITWTNGSSESFREFNIKREFVTRDEAEWEGLGFARKWIDEGKPNVRDDIAD